MFNDLKLRGYFVVFQMVLNCFVIGINCFNFYFIWMFLCWFFLFGFLDVEYFGGLCLLDVMLFG